MFNPLIISITYFSVLLLLFAVTYCAGHFIFRSLKINSPGSFWSDFFFKTLAGATFIIVLGSLICTKGKTINFVFLVAAAFIFLERSLTKKNTVSVPVKIPQKLFGLFNLKNTLSLFFIISLVFAWQASIVLKCGTFPIDIIEKDSFFYAEISKCLVNTGWENTFTASNLVNPDYNFPTPYHYYDIWLNGIVCKIFHLNNSLSLYLVIYSLFSVMFLTGLLSVIEKFASIKIIHVVAVLPILFMGGLYISDNVFHLYQYSAEMEGMQERYGGKMVPVYCFVLSVIILFVINKNIKLALIILLCLPVIFISLAPAVFSGLLFFCAYKMFRKNEDRKFYLRLIFYCIAVMASIGLFYFLFKKNDLNYRLDKPLMNYTDLYSFSFFRIKFYLVELFLKCYSQPFLFILDYFPFVLIFLYVITRKNADQNFRSIFVLFSLIWLGGLIAANTFYLMDDAYQLYTNMLVFWHVLFGFAFILFIFHEKSNGILKYAIGGPVILCLLYNGWNSWHSFEKIDYYDPKVSEKYLIEVNIECDKFDHTIKGATFYKDDFYNNLLISYPLEYYCFPFIISQKAYVPFNLTSIEQVPERNKYQIEKSVSKSPFNQYLKSEANILTGEGLLQRQIAFIKKYEIGYLICPKEQTTDFKNYFKIKAEITDSLTGQRFIILDQEP